MDSLIEENYEQTIPKVLFYIFLVIMKTVVEFIVNLMFGTCKKKKNQSKIKAQLLADQLNKSDSSSLNQEELKKKIRNLKVEYERYNCPSDFTKAAKIQREISKLEKLIDSDQNESISELKLSGLFNFESIKSSMTAALTVKLIFGIITGIYIYSTTNLYILIPQNDFLSIFFSYDKETSFLKIKFWYVIVGINLIISKLIGICSSSWKLLVN